MNDVDPPRSAPIVSPRAVGTAADTPFGPRLAALLAPAGWTVEGSAEQPWLRAVPVAARPLPPQGWKLHLSASDLSADTVLGRAVPLLVAANVEFKVASTRGYLALLNSGDAGFSQIGKFVTAYPVDTDEAVALAAALERELADLSGPIVPSDLALHDGGVVSYRYGSFHGRLMQSPHGPVVQAVEDADGALVPDTRFREDVVPSWLDDPFRAAGLVQPPAPRPVLVGGRFLPVSTVHWSPRSSLHFAIDLHTLQRCVLKQAALNGDPFGVAARLAHEHAMIAAVDGCPGVVRVVGWMDGPDEVVLALEDIEGSTLEVEAGADALTGNRLAPARVVDIGVQLAAIVAGLHRRGVVHRDIKPGNVLVDGDGTVRLIDFELAARIGDAEPFGYGTLGYVGPEQHRREPVHPADDVYALGGTLYTICTGAVIGTRPLSGPLSHRVRDLAPEVPAALAAVIERCLSDTQDERYADAGELHDALLALGTVRGEPTVRYGAIAGVPADAQERALGLALRLADALIADAVPHGPGATWLSRHRGGPGVPTRDLNTGAAGTVLALAAVAELTGEQAHLDAVAAGARWLDAVAPPEGPRLGGLYVGEAGVAVTLLRAGRLLGDDRLVASALERGRFVAGLPHGSVDLFNGTAGRARAHLWLADATGDGGQLDAARAAGLRLCEQALRPAPGQAAWRSMDEVGGEVQHGYAHGAAGIADVLVDLAAATGEERFLATAIDVGRWLVSEAVPFGDGAVAWPHHVGGTPMGPMWCHGAVGIGRFLLNLDRAGGLAAVDRWLHGAVGVAAARHGRTLGPLVCHGLGGSIDHLVDLNQVDQAGGHLAEAWSLAGLLERYHHEGSDGQLRCSSERPSISSPDLTSGYAGIMAVWLRLARPELPTLLAGRSADVVRR